MIDQVTANIAGIREHSFVDGVGARLVVFFQGCPHNCYGCHNPSTRYIDGGSMQSVDMITHHIEQTKYIDGITLSGGEPLMQPECCSAIAQYAHSLGLDVWLYSGWTFEQILEGRAGAAARTVLNDIDVLVDGPFVNSLKSDLTPFRGSSNQRLVDVKSSLENNIFIEYKY